MSGSTVNGEMAATAWATGTTYSADQKVSAAVGASGVTANFICTKSHVAATANQPPMGTNWAGSIKAPDNRPFFVSAGPDGNFATGDDNVYSFEN